MDTRLIFIRYYKHGTAEQTATSLIPIYRLHTIELKEKITEEIVTIPHAKNYS